MSDSKTLAERIAACCPCRTNTPCFLFGSAKERTKQSCVCGSHKLKEVDGWRILEPKPCLWPGHAVEAEVAAMGECLAVEGCPHPATHCQDHALGHLKRAEVVERLLAEAPSPPLDGDEAASGEDCYWWMQKEYVPWLARVRDAGGKQGETR